MFVHRSKICNFSCYRRVDIILSSGYIGEMKILLLNVFFFLKLEIHKCKYVFFLLLQQGDYRIEIDHMAFFLPRDSAAAV